jgi:hypothetical protein
MDGNNWLEAKVITCPLCGIQLWCVIHSPFYNEHRMYCDRCPRAVEVSYYDPTYKRITNRLPAPRTWEQVMAAIEPLLRDCSCGGRFRADAPRHCFSCGAVVPAAADKDLWPYTGCEDAERDPSPEEQAEFDRFEAAFVVREGIWAESSGDRP